MFFVTEYETVIKEIDGKICHGRGFDNAIDLNSHTEWEDFLEKHFGKVIIFKRESDYLIIKSINQTMLSAHSDGTLSLGKEYVRECEVFRGVDQHFASLFWNKESDRLKVVVAKMLDESQPVKLHVACGQHPIEGFLNIDYFCHAPEFKNSLPDQYFITHTVGSPIHLPDESVDFVFHEHFLEHICQFDQICFLAETYRLLKPGGVHRVNMPELLWNMRVESDFTKGYAGVLKCHQEHGHIGYLTYSLLKELAGMVGYREALVMTRGQSISRFAIPDRRPIEIGVDDGNIFMDLVK